MLFKHFFKEKKNKEYWTSKPMRNITTNSHTHILYRHLFVDNDNNIFPCIRIFSDNISILQNVWYLRDTFLCLLAFVSLIWRAFVFPQLKSEYHWNWTETLLWRYPLIEAFHSIQNPFCPHITNEISQTNSFYLKCSRVFKMEIRILFINRMHITMQNVQVHLFFPWRFSICITDASAIFDQQAEICKCICKRQIRSNDSIICYAFFTKRFQK